jgi:hypothetical protein
MGRQVDAVSGPSADRAKEIIAVPFFVTDGAGLIKNPDDLRHRQTCSGSTQPRLILNGHWTPAQLLPVQELF